MKVDWFLYGPEPNKGLVYNDTPNIHKILPEELIIELQNLPITQQPIKRLHNMPQGSIITISFVEKAKDSLSRDTVRNHTFILPLNQIVDYFTAKLEPYKGKKGDVNV